MFNKKIILILMVVLGLVSCSKESKLTPDQVFEKYIGIIGEVSTARDPRIDQMLSQRAATYKNKELADMFSEVPPDRVDTYERVALKMLQAPIQRPEIFETNREYGAESAILIFKYGHMKNDEKIEVVERIAFVNENGWKIDKITKTTSKASLDGSSNSSATEEHF